MDLVGIEPTTSSMPWKRAPSCATGPHEKRLRGAKANQFSPTAIDSQTRDAMSASLCDVNFAKAGKLSILSDDFRQPLMTRNSIFVFDASSCCRFVWRQAPRLSPPTSPRAQGPVSYSSVNELNGLLSQLEQASQAAQVDLAKMRIEKWKTDSGSKRQAEGNVDSIQRNLQTALPEIIAQLKASPESLTATFKLYRNLDALYDVFESVAESAGAFGSKDEFQSLQNDVNCIRKSAARLRRPDGRVWRAPRKTK